MTITFIPNDPLAGSPADRQQAVRKNRPASRAGFTFFDAVPEKPYDRDSAPLEFLFWQCREAALAAVEMWEELDGNLSSWANGTKLDLSQDFDDPEFAGPSKLNAFYDGQGLRFFHFDGGQQDTYSGISTDTVAHETGHALLDVLRPEFFSSFRPEVNAFHEAFGDCVSILTALHDQATRVALLLESPDLNSENFVEAGSEYLSGAIRQQFGNVAPSQPRHAFNDFNWQLPTTLPAGRFQDPPELLTAESHSFSRVFTGCFYDVIRFIFADLPASQRNPAGLLTAAQTAGRLLIAAVRSTPETSRYFRAVGRRMVLADEQSNNGANRMAIRNAFSRHDISLGSWAMMTPTAALDGPAPTLLKASAKLTAKTARDIRKRIGATARAKFSVVRRELFGHPVAEALHQREVDLSACHSALKGVVVHAAESIMIGSSGERAAVLDALPNPEETVDEVQSYVRSLIHSGCLEVGKTTRRAAVPSAKEPNIATHVIRTRGKKRVVERVRYVCGCH